jgi:hypothetical protein
MGRDAHTALGKAPGLRTNAVHAKVYRGVPGIAANGVTILQIGPDDLSTGLAGVARPLGYAIRWRVIKHPR